MKVYGVVTTGGCYCDCSTDYCTGVDFEKEVSLYLTYDLAKAVLDKAVLDHKYVRVSDDSVVRYSTYCAMSRDHDDDEVGNGTEDNSTVTEYMEIIEYDVVES